MFDGKKVIVIGERDGIAGPAIAACGPAAGCPVAFVSPSTVASTAAVPRVLSPPPLNGAAPPGLSRSLAIRKAPTAAAGSM